MSVRDLILLALFTLGAAAYAAVRVGAMFDAEFDSSSPANDVRDQTGARSRRASRWGK
ncbi:MAG: hypothetical protein RXR52_42100 [Paraburkholderia sp.]|uniref:hypothetical protein n=1 Tax=Burkholderiaceae TaxID=119060 RepID=UPI001484D01E|nr:hypothetical protein [Burkholderia sp. 4M9327F10]